MRTPSSHLIARLCPSHHLVATILLLASLGSGGQAVAEADGITPPPPTCPPMAGSPKPPSPDMKMREPRSLASDFMKKRWEKIDTNKDGIISKEEYLKEASDRFDATDANHDGRITPDEAKAFFDKIDAARARAEAFKRKCAADAAPRP